jgi:hypothetical protein
MIAPEFATMLALRSHVDKGPVHVMLISLALSPTPFSHDFTMFHTNVIDDTSRL